MDRVLNEGETTRAKIPEAGRLVVVWSVIICTGVCALCVLTDQTVDEGSFIHFLSALTKCLPCTRYYERMPGQQCDLHLEVVGRQGKGVSRKGQCSELQGIHLLLEEWLGALLWREP